MARKSFFEVVEYIKAFSNSHTQLKKVGADFLEQIDGILTESEAYPAFFIVPKSSNIGESVNTWVVDIYCVDVIQKDRKNLVNIISDTALILNDLHLFLTDGDNWDFEAELITDIEPINNYTVDYLAGNVGTFSISVESYGVCEIPMGEIVPPFKVCLPSTYLVRYENGTEIEAGEIASGGNKIVEVPNPTICEDVTFEITDEDFNTLYSGTEPAGGLIEKVILNSKAVLKDTGGVVISETELLAQETKDITAPNGSVTINTTPVGSVKSNGNLPLIVELDGEESGELNLTNGKWEIKKGTRWERPSDWLEIDSYITEEAHGFMGLKSIFSDKPNLQVITCGVAFTISVDGVSTNYSAFQVVELSFNFNDISPLTETSEGFRQVRIGVYPQAGTWTGTFSIVNPRTSAPTSWVSNFIDIRMHAPNISAYTMYSTTGGCLPYLEKHNIIGANPSISRSTFQRTNLKWLGDDLTNCTGLGSFLTGTMLINQFSDETLIPNFNLNTSTINNFISNSRAKYIGNFTANSATAASTSAFAALAELVSFGNLSLAVTTGVASIFAGDFNLKTMGSSNLPLCTSIASAWLNCHKLETQGVITTTAALTNISFAWSGDRLLKGIELTNCAGVTNTASALTECNSLEYIIFTGITRGFTIPPCRMNEAAFINTFNALGIAGGAPLSQQIVITGNIALMPSTIAIATGKGFVVIP